MKLRSRGAAPPTWPCREDGGATFLPSDWIEAPGAGPGSAGPGWVLVVRGWSPPPARVRQVRRAPAPPRRELAPPSPSASPSAFPSASPSASASPPPDPSPTPLALAAALRGDPEAWSGILAPLRGRLLALAERRIPPELRRRFDAEDVVQETCVRLLERLSTFEDRGPGSFLGWVHTVLENTLADDMRYHRRQRRTTAREVDVDCALEVADPAGGARSPLGELTGLEERLGLAQAVGDLDVRERRLLGERFDEGRSFAQIARGRGWSESTARRRLGELVGRLRGRLNALSPVP